MHAEDNFTAKKNPNGRYAFAAACLESGLKTTTTAAAATATTTTRGRTEGADGGAKVQQSIMEATEAALFRPITRSLTNCEEF